MKQCLSCGFTCPDSFAECPRCKNQQFGPVGSFNGNGAPVTPFNSQQAQPQQGGSLQNSIPSGAPEYDFINGGDEFNTQTPPMGNPYQGGYQTPPPKKAKPVAPASDNMGVIGLGEWIVTLLLLNVPIVNIIYLIVNLASSKTNPNKKNFLKAALIVGIVVGLLFGILVGSQVKQMLAGGGSMGSLGGY